MSDASDLFRSQEGIGAHGAFVPGPPWILGRRGAPREAPENTLAGLRRGVELGLDGFSYELRACLSGELVLLADETLERTTDLFGALADKTLPELAAADAGGWFAKRFRGEPLALFEETLELPGNRAGTYPQHLIELDEPGLVDYLARALEGGGERLSVRVASTRTAICAEARAAGLDALWVVPEADERVRERARAEGLAGVASRRGWRAGESWPCERWALGIDDPDDLLAAVLLPVGGLTTTEPRRALATRALCFLADGDPGRYPLRVPPLEIEPRARRAPTDRLGPAEWWGVWDLEVEVVNPLPYQVRVALELVVRRGAFEAEGLPAAARLAPGQSVRFPLHLVGGSWRLGGDPLLVAHFFWDPGPGRPGEHLALDAPLERRRTLRLGTGARRVELVRERPGDPPATMTVSRRGRELVAAIEDPGGLVQARTLVHLDGVVYRGGRGLRLPLPADAHQRPQGLAFSVGISGRLGAPGERTVRRWAGGLPDVLEGGAPGRLVVQATD